MKRDTRELLMIKMFCILIVVVVSQVYTFDKMHQTVQSEWMRFIIGKYKINFKNVYRAS